jgi:outer membrane protein OmpA-like peptidoglycan-associated protein
MRVFTGLSAAILALALGPCTAAAQEANLLALGDGVLPVVEPPSYGGEWRPVDLIDESPRSGWASPKGTVTKAVFVFELPVPGTPGRFEFDTASVDGDGRGAKDVLVEVSAVSKDAGFEPVLKASLAGRKDGQAFPASKKVEGRFVRLTVASNHGDAEYVELMGFRAFGTRGAAPPAAQVVGTFDTNYSPFHLRQQGTAISGCYEHDEGLFTGTVEGRVAKLTWTQAGGRKKGPAVFVFSPDGKAFRGYWWYDTDKAKAPDGDWNGTRSSTDVGGCPHWSGSVGGQLRKELAASGRARLYGILFDTGSAKLKPESLPTLDEVVKLLSAEPSWSLLVEGHTDSTSTAALNQTLSEQRASSVKDYLAGKGVAASRLSTAGFGSSRPVADNATELGRAQNRRVELVKK